MAAARVAVGSRKQELRLNGDHYSDQCHTGVGILKHVDSDYTGEEVVCYRNFVYGRGSNWDSDDAEVRIDNLAGIEFRRHAGLDWVD